MLLHVPNVLTAEQVAQRATSSNARTGSTARVTAGAQSSRAKQNLQLPENSPAARELGDVILAALQRNPLFMSAALPLKVFPPLFNRYGGGHSFGSHVDNAIRQVPGTPHRVRTDLSATLFLVDPDSLRRRRAGRRRHLRHAHASSCRRAHLILYPSTSLHHVHAGHERRARWRRSSGSRAWCATTAGARCCSTWTRRDPAASPATCPDHPSTVQLTGVYHNLLRQWSEL